MVLLLLVINTKNTSPNKTKVVTQESVTPKVIKGKSLEESIYSRIVKNIDNSKF